MSKFKNIDVQLLEFCSKIGGRLTKDRPGYPEMLRTFEERRIDWVDGDISKAIIIQPTFEATGVNGLIWNVVNVAWRKCDRTGHIYKWTNYLLRRVNFETIEMQIDSILSQSMLKLDNVDKSDLG